MFSMFVLLGFRHKSQEKHFLKQVPLELFNHADSYGFLIHMYVSGISLTALTTRIYDF